MKNIEIIKEENGIKAGVIENHLKVPASLALLISHGWGNGYLGLPEGHPWYNMDYNEIPIEVHCGLTFGELLEDGLYWIGFDTAHARDNEYNWPKEKVIEETINMLDQAKLKI